MGADVVKIEPVGGDATRHLLGSGAGYFPMYNRNKRSLCVNLKSEQGKAAVLKRMLSPNSVAIRRLSQKEGISEATLHKRRSGLARPHRGHGPLFIGETAFPRASAPSGLGRLYIKVRKLSGAGHRP